MMNIILKVLKFILDIGVNLLPIFLSILILMVIVLLYSILMNFKINSVAVSRLIIFGILIAIILIYKWYLKKDK